MISRRTRCKPWRDNPHLVAALLRRFPPRLGAGLAFERAVFGEEGHPESGLMALAYCCKNFVKLWTIMGWPRDWQTQSRLIKLAPWSVKPEDIDEVIRSENKLTTTGAGASSMRLNLLHNPIRPQLNEPACLDPPHLLREQWRLLRRFIRLAAENLAQARRDP